jgi:hypothetical protein
VLWIRSFGSSSKALCVDGEHFFDLLADDVVFDFIITVPNYPRLGKGEMIALAVDVLCCATMNRRSPPWLAGGRPREVSNRILTGFDVSQSSCLVHRWTTASGRPVGEIAGA